MGGNSKDRAPVSSGGGYVAGPRGGPTTSVVASGPGGITTTNGPPSGFADWAADHPEYFGPNTGRIKAAVHDDDPGNRTKREYGNAPTRVKMSGMPPGGYNMIAGQLARGFGAPKTDYRDWLTSIYDPVETVQLMEPISTTKAAMASGKFKPIKGTGNLALNHILNGG